MRAAKLEVPLTPNLAPRLAPPCANDGASTLVQNMEANPSSNRKQGGLFKTSCLFIDTTIVDIWPFRPQINKIMLKDSNDAEIANLEKLERWSARRWRFCRRRRVGL